MSNEIKIEIIEHPGEDLCEAVNHLLRTYNQTVNPICWRERDKVENQPKPLNIFALGKNRSPIGGLFGTTQFSWLKIHRMATRKDWRGKGVGKALLARAEEVAKERGCRYAYTGTMEYQAPTFYQKAGYRMVGELEDWDSHGHKKLFFTKVLE